MKQGFSFDSISAAFPIAPLSMKERIPPCSTDVGGGHWLVLRVELRKTRVLKRSYAAIWPAVYNRETTASPSAAFVSSAGLWGVSWGTSISRQPGLLGRLQEGVHAPPPQTPLLCPAHLLLSGMFIPWLPPLKQGQ